MGPQAPSRNSTSGLFVRPSLGSQDRGLSERASGGAFFAGGSRDRFGASLKPVGKVAAPRRSV